jgi:hypothetical protein
MTLAEALALVRQQKEAIRKRKLFLACGFEPLHLGTFLQGHFTQRFQEAEYFVGRRAIQSTAARNNRTRMIGMDRPGVALGRNGIY